MLLMCYTLLISSSIIRGFYSMSDACTHTGVQTQPLHGCTIVVAQEATERHPATTDSAVDRTWKEHIHCDTILVLLE